MSWIVRADNQFCLDVSFGHVCDQMAFSPCEMKSDYFVENCRRDKRRCRLSSSSSLGKMRPTKRIRIFTLEMLEFHVVK